MKHIPLLLTAAAVLSLSAFAQQTPPKTHLKVGDTAPDFTLTATDRSKISLADFRGKNTVVLAFFPAAFTGGCTAEMKSYHADIAKFEAAGAKVFGISTDNTPSQAYWATEVLKVNVPMLSDFHKKTSEAYGVLMPSGVANRTTFVVDPAGKIQYIEEGKAAIDPTGAATACSRLKK
jgi:peroxiredoxin